MKSDSILLLLFLLCFFSCENKITIHGFPSEEWKQDKGGCKEKRKELLKHFLQIKNQLKGHTSEEIVEFLGKADKNDLGSRNQKVFYYYLEKGSHCNDISHSTEANYIYIKFSALNKANEISYSY